MDWDFAEANPFGAAQAVTGLSDSRHGLEVLGRCQPTARHRSRIAMRRTAVHSIQSRSFLSTDPPYYDNIPYADLSDFFYIWLRRILQRVLSRTLGTFLFQKRQNS